MQRLFRVGPAVILSFISAIFLICFVWQLAYDKLAASFDVVGWFARDIALFEKVGSVLLGEDGAKSPTRLIVAEDAWALLEKPVGAALEPALARVKAVLPMIEETRLNGEGLTDWFEVFRTLQAAEIWATLGGWVTQANPQLGPGVKNASHLQRQLRPTRLRPRMCAAARSPRGSSPSWCLRHSPYFTLKSPSRGIMWSALR